MTTLMINASPKKKMSVSAYFLSVLRFFTFGRVKKETLRGKGDTERVLGAAAEADNIVFVLPLYVDGIPSHLLTFLRELESRCRENGCKANVYAVSNGGFIEGDQNRVLMSTLENFCTRSGLEWRGGIGIGGGVMLNVMRIMFFVFIGIFVLRMVMGAALGDALMIFAKQLAMIIFFHLKNV